MIGLENVSKSYGERAVLRGVSLTVGRGEVVALVGPNGAGKSTLLRIIAGIIRPDGGSARIDGHAPDTIDGRRSLGYLPQKPGIPLATSILALTRLVADIRDISMDVAIAGLRDAGLLSRFHAAIGELSGGERQRLMLALATLGPVTSLLLDEPGISLDADGAEDVHDRIREARSRGTSVLFASHHLADVAVLADRLAILVQGELIAQGTLIELARKAGVSWNSSAEPPIEAIYRSLVRRSTAQVRSVA